MGDDQKFWVGIASAFIIPTLAYVYMQGMTAQSINQLVESVNKYQETADSLNTNIHDVSNLASVNKLYITKMNNDLEKLSIELDDQNRRITIIESKNQKG